MADISKIKTPSGTIHDLKDTKARQQVLTFTNLNVNLSNAVADTTYSNYPYSVKIYLAGVTQYHVPTVHLKTPSNLVSDLCESGNGYVKLYANTNTGTIAIDNVVCERGGN